MPTIWIGARIFPDNENDFNEEGIKFYEEVFKSLNENGIKPIPILYHWDSPLWLEEKGGTSSRVFLNAFRNFSKILFERLGKYTDIWYISDENSSYTTSAYLDDYNPPQKKMRKNFGKQFIIFQFQGLLLKRNLTKLRKKVM